MKNFPLIAQLIIFSLVLYSCGKDISEPKHKANGSNVVYLKVDDNKEYLLEDRNRRLHKRTAGKFEDDNKDAVWYSEYTMNNREFEHIWIGIFPFDRKANFREAGITLRIDKQTQEIDTTFLREHLKKTWDSKISFEAYDGEYKAYYIDSIIDYKIIKWDKVKHIFTFSANCTYSHSPKYTPPNPRIYFYVDIKYDL
ncbi:MAG TPA: hypothetical protein PK323_10875 [Bacteroidia bacterium]|nr:hypothetical protein [Bacteroidia bacterium]